MIAKIQSGHLGGDVYTLQLKNGGLKIAYNPGYSLSAAAKAAGDKAIADITSGAVTVTP
jgi:basic membrane lipoprotein Med (substrate-binding protein (PBP1-ABC) superfamily)